MSRSKWKLLTTGIITLLLATEGNAERRGEAVFDRLGDIAQPAFYGTTGIKVTFDADNYAPQKVNETLEKELEDLWRVLQTKQDLSPKEARDSVNRIRRGIEAAVTRYNRVAEGMKVLTDMGTQKRFVMAMALTSMAGSIFALGSALYSRQDLIRLGKQNRTLKRRVDRTQHLLRDLGNRVSQWHREKLLDDLERKIIAGINDRLDDSTDYLEDVEAGRYAALEHRLHPRLVKPHHLAAVAKDIKETAAEKGAQPVLNPSTHIWDYPLSYALSTKGLVLFVHTPMVRDGQSMLRQLWKLNSAVIGQDDKLHAYGGEDKFIATNRNLQVHTTHTVSDLEECDRIGRTYICTHQTVLHKTPSTCTAALFYGESELAAAVCKKELVGPTLPVVELAANHYLVQEDQTMTVNCNKDRPTIKKVKAGDEVITEPGCSWTGTDFILVGNEGDKSHVLKANHTLTAKLAEENEIQRNLDKVVQEALSEFKAWEEAPLAVPEVSRHPDFIEPDDEFFEEDYDEEGENDLDWVLISTAIALVCTSTFFTAILCGIGYYRWCKRRDGRDNSHVEEMGHGRAHSPPLPACRQQQGRRGPGRLPPPPREQPPVSDSPRVLTQQPVTTGSRGNPIPQPAPTLHLPPQEEREREQAGNGSPPGIWGSKLDEYAMVDPGEADAHQGRHGENGAAVGGEGAFGGQAADVGERKEGDLAA